MFHAEYKKKVQGGALRQGVGGGSQVAMAAGEVEAAAGAEATAGSEGGGAGGEGVCWWDDAG